jgi:MFS family permease
VLAIGAATLADIFEPAERGTKLGIYYAAPLLGPSLGPLLGGALTQVFSWRGSFWFLAAFGLLNLLSFLLFFKDTFRKERSWAYQNALRNHSRKISRVIPVNAGDPCEKALPESNSQSDIIFDGNISIMHVNPIRPLWLVLRRMNNLLILLASGTFYLFPILSSVEC